MKSGNLVLKGWLITYMMLLASVVEAQQIYKWTDEKGALHYSQTPPPARFSQAVSVKARVTAPNVPTAAATGKDSSKPATDNSTTATATAAPKAPKLSAETCQTMQNNLAQLQTGRRLYEKDAGGERAYVTEERRAQQIQVYQQNLKNGCG